MPEYYSSPGVAAADAITGFLAEREAKKRQAMMDVLNAQHAADAHSLAIEQLKELKDTAATRIADREKAAIEKTTAGMVRGDIPSADIVAKAKTHGVPLPQEVIPDQGMVAQPQATQIVPAMGAPTPAPPALVPLPLRFAGQPAERRAASAQQLEQQLGAAISKAPDRKTAVSIALQHGVPYAQVDDVVNAIMGPKATLPSSAQEYEYARAQGFKGTFEQYQNEDANRKRSASGAMGDAALNLTSQGLDTAAMMYAKTGTLPPMGMGPAGAKIRTAVINRAASYDADTGKFTSTEPVDVASAQAGFKADQAALSQLQKNMSAVEAFAGTAKRNGQLLLDMLKELPDTGSSLLNTPFRATSKAFGSEDMARFNTFRQSLQNEYARIITNPTLTGTMTDTARKEMETVLNPGATVGQLRAALDALSAEAENRRSSFAEEIANVKARIKGGPKKAEEAAPVVSSPVAIPTVKPTHRFNPATGAVERVAP
jgi:hypothetical protein